MALIDRLPAREAAQAAARALEQVLGHDVILALGEPIVAPMDATMLPPGGARCVALPFGNGIVGEVTLVVTELFAASMEAATPDAQLLSAALPALQSAADAIEPTIYLHAVAEHAGEIAIDTLLTSVIGDFVSVPVLESDERVACVVVRILDDEPQMSAAMAPTTPMAPASAAPVEPSTITLPNDPAPMVHAPATAPAPIAAAATAPTQPTMAATPAPAPVPAGNGSGHVVLHQFNPLNGAGGLLPAPRPLTLLNDVHLEIIAELGRRPMKVRDLVALEAGSVIELDRAAGSPVDLLVNGSLLGHGEVVVIDEEFGIRISEIIVGDN